MKVGPEIALVSSDTLAHHKDAIDARCDALAEVIAVDPTLAATFARNGWTVRMMVLGEALAAGLATDERFGS